MQDQGQTTPEPSGPLGGGAGGPPPPGSAG
jgi:hypothetical protein